MASSADHVKLLGSRISPFVHRIIWALKIKCIPFEYVEEDLLNKSSMLLEYNPIHKKVPVLVHGGKPIAESAVILEYIEETWPQNYLLWCGSPYDRAMSRFWARYLDEKLGLAIWNVFGFATTEPEKHVDAALQVLQVIEDHLKDKKFFVGKTMGFADITAAWMAYMFQPLEEVAGIKLLGEERFPYIHAWSMRILEVPVIKDNIPTKDEMITYFRMEKQIFLEAARAASASN